MYLGTAGYQVNVLQPLLVHAIGLCEGDLLESYKLVPGDIELVVRGPLHHIVDAVPGEQGRGDALQKL